LALLISDNIDMTSMPRLMVVAEASDDVAAELTNLRAAYQATCAELIDCRRQRDEAVAHGQELLARLVEADEKLAALSVPVAPVAPVEPVAPVAVVETVESDPIRVAPPTPTPEPISPVPTIVEATPSPGAIEPVRWLPPEEDGSSSSSAHEFAALKEIGPDAEDEVSATYEPLASPMNVLPDAVEEPKGSRWRLRTR
jgi:hypothetical protein